MKHRAFTQSESGLWQDPLPGTALGMAQKRNVRRRSRQLALAEVRQLFLGFVHRHEVMAGKMAEN